MNAVKNQNLTKLQSILEETAVDIVNTISENNE